MTQEPQAAVHSDEELMTAVSSGDHMAFCLLVKRHQDVIWRAACRYTGNSEDARDICQTVFLKLYEARYRYKTSAAFKTYLFHIMNNTCIDLYRKKRHENEKYTMEANETISSPVEEIEVHERNRRLSSKVAQLPERQRRVVALRYETDLSIKDIALIMGISQKAVERLLSRAREALRNGIQQVMN